MAIAMFFVGHWTLSVFFQTFFLHRYGAHRMFTMSKTWERIFYVQPEPKFDGGLPEWKAIDTLGRSWIGRFAWVAAYTLFYVKFATAPWMFVLLPFHYVMGPVHGAIVNWCGHKYGYKNFQNGDDSKNTLPFDFVTLGELFQNNHHKFGMAPNFAVRWFELDPTYLVIRVFAWLRIIDLGSAPQMGRYDAEAAA
jgi:stearoyl-CoA desaturase (delta-9 desaturase)